MKLQDANINHYNTVTHLTPTQVKINQRSYTESILLTPTTLKSPWEITTFSALSAEAIAEVIALKPEVVLIGSGQKQHFLAPQLAQIFWQAHIGVECMDLSGACRTYNILMSEERKVVALLFFE